MAKASTTRKQAAGRVAGAMSGSMDMPVQIPLVLTEPPAHTGADILNDHVGQTGATMGAGMSGTVVSFIRKPSVG